MISPIETFTRKDDALLFHIVLLPNHQTGQAIAGLSRELNSSSYVASFYELDSGEESEALPGTIKSLFEENAHLLSGKFSLPHATLTHLWATPQQVEQLVSAFSGSGLKTQFDITIRGLELCPPSPRFLGKPDEKDHVAWLNVRRDRTLQEARDIVDHIVESSNLQVMGARDEDWYPHVTMAAERCEEVSILHSVTRANLLQMEPQSVSLRFGLSGPNGQFRGALATGEELKRGLPLEIFRQRLQKAYILEQCL